VKHTLVAVAFAFALVPRLAVSDGIVIKPHEDGYGWRPATENLQQALITHRDGIERLTVAIEVDAAGAKSVVWLLPVPATPKQVHVDVLSSFPSIGGTEVYGGALENLGNMRMAAVILQVWPPLVGAIFYLGGSALEAIFGGSDRRMAAPKAAAPAKGEAVEVHERVEKQGMVSEVITAREGSALYGYLAGKGLNLKAGAVPTLDHYIGKDYTFVASWFSAGVQAGKDPERFQNRAIEIRFPTEEMFFPLFPTSAYGDRVVPASIRVAGHVSPRPFADIAQRTSIGYYVSRMRGEDGMGPLGTDLYTKIDIDAPAKAFTQDLWISPKPPRQQGLELATFVVRYPVIAFALLLVPVSMLLSLTAGWVAFRELRTGKGALRLMLVGLGNCVTLLGMLATVRALPKGRKQRFGYLVAFSLLFMLGMAVVTWQGDSIFEPMKPRTIPFRTSSVDTIPEKMTRSEREAKTIGEPAKQVSAVSPSVAGTSVVAVKGSEAELIYQQALAMEGGGKVVDAIRIYRRAARAGSGKAAKRLGDIFERGMPGVSRDYAESLQWYETARQLGETVDPSEKH